ncbi:cupin domain-containing protein [Egicoccus sp. AB-alg2]|uniref:cupin domain-containing protein n=1 Tax=Egicoccus sp. AB-alg2 TaxID=3242693 RepID=UPI00359E3B6A
MRTTRFDATPDGGVRVVVDEAPAFAPMPDWNGETLNGVRLHEIERRGDIELQLVEIAAGGSFVMHASPKLAFCHVVRGAGRLGLPGGESLAYRGPETYVFHPGALHDWHDVEEDTLLAVAIVPDAT